MAVIYALSPFEVYKPFAWAITIINHFQHKVVLYAPGCTQYSCTRSMVSWNSYFIIMNFIPCSWYNCTGCSQEHRIPLCVGNGNRSRLIMIIPAHAQMYSTSAIFLSFTALVLFLRLRELHLVKIHPIAVRILLVHVLLFNLLAM